MIKLRIRRSCAVDIDLFGGDARFTDLPTGS